MKSTSLLTVLLLALFSFGCALLPNFGGPPPQARGPEKAPAFPYNDYRGIIHCHSHHSHDSDGSEEEIVAAAQAVGIDFIIMTDHYDKTTDPGVEQAIRGMRGRTLFLGGAELRKDGGSLLVLGAEKNFDPKASSAEIARAVHEQGGLVFVGHLEQYRGDLNSFPFDGFEIYNVHAAAKAVNPIAMILRALILPPNLVFRSLAKYHPPNLSRWDRWLEERAVPICAGNDAHANVKIFGPLGGTIGTYEQLFRTVTTHVWAKSLDKKEILSALREGRSYISFDVLRDATGFAVFAEPDGSQMRWKVSSPETARIVLLQNGKIVAQNEGQWLEFLSDEPEKIYRVEVYLKNRPWILAGPFKAPTP